MGFICNNFPVNILKKDTEMSAGVLIYNPIKNLIWWQSFQLKPRDREIPTFSLNT
jgi:hypothetical protein